MCKLNNILRCLFFLCVIIIFNVPTPFTYIIIVEFNNFICSLYLTLPAGCIYADYVGQMYENTTRHSRQVYYPYELISRSCLSGSLCEAAGWPDGGALAAAVR